MDGTVGAAEAVLLEAVAAAEGLLWDAVGVAEAVGGPERLQALRDALGLLREVAEGVDGFTACEECGELSIPVVEGVAAERCDECEGV